MLESLEKLNWNVLSILKDMCQRNSEAEIAEAVAK